jgi:hypothetical protein
MIVFQDRLDRVQFVTGSVSRVRFVDLTLIRSAIAIVRISALRQPLINDLINGGRQQACGKAETNRSETFPD